MGVNWRMVARRLGVTDEEIDEIECDYCNLRKRSYQAFCVWLHRNGGFENANPNEICDVLLSFELNRIAADFFENVNFTH